MQPENDIQSLTTGTEGQGSPPVREGRASGLAMGALVCALAGVGILSCASDALPDAGSDGVEVSTPAPGAESNAPANQKRSRPARKRDAAGREIHIDFATRGTDPKRSMFGLNHGLLRDKPSDGLLRPLPITYYRSGKNLWNGLTERMLAHSPETLVHVFMAPGSYDWWDRQRHGRTRAPYDPHGKGKTDWSVYDAYLNAFLSDLASRPRWVSALNEGRLILGPWNEAINNKGDFGDQASHQYFYGSEEQFYATFKRAHDAVRARFPNAKICGPSYGTDFSFGPALDKFMVWARGADIQLDALCVHAISDTPNRFPEFEEKVRAFRTKYIESPEWKSLGVKEIHVDEVLHTRNQRNPATLLGMLTFLERSGADYGTKNSGPKFGWNGSLSGLLNEAGQPLAAYWVPHRYGKMLTGRRTFRAPVRTVDGIVSIGEDGVGRAMFGHMASEGSERTRTVPVRISGLSQIGKPPYRIKAEGSLYGPDAGVAHMKPKLLWERTTTDSSFTFEHELKTHDVTYLTIEAGG